MSMKKEKFLNELRAKRLVAIIRAENAEKACELSRAVIKGNIQFIELTFTVPNAQDAIKELKQQYFEDEELFIGAGTVLDPETARIAMLAGADFIVSPFFDEAIARMCNRYRVPYLPGVATVQEAISALELGADVLKLFPGDFFSNTAIKTFKGPLPQAEFMPTGGVSEDNIEDWLESGALAVGLGSFLTSMSGDEDDYQEITDKAQRLVDRLN